MSRALLGASQPTVTATNPRQCELPRKWNHGSGSYGRAEKLIGLASSQRRPILVPAQSNKGESL
jgi:hypothetical protein